MPNVWSFNTTLRNPDRMESMLRALSELEGVDFDQAGQREFFGLQIKKHLYKPTKSKLADPDLISAVYDDNPDDLDDNLVEKILSLYDEDSVDGSGRGRTPAGVLNRFGLCVALKSRGPVVITPLGKKWLNGEVLDEELFTKFFLKWQYTNPIEDGYRGFDIKPFVGLLSLIQSVNEKWKLLGNNPVGISKDEYSMFVSSLTKKSLIEDYAQRIIEFRKVKMTKSGIDLRDYIAEYTRARVREIYGPTKDIVIAMNDLRDYTDSSIRYFHVSGIIVFRGDDTHVDIARDKGVEADSITKSIDAGSQPFDSYESYLEYLSNINSLGLPWENEEDLKEISTKLSAILHEEAQQVQFDEEKVLAGIQEESTADQVESLQTALNDVRVEKLRVLKHDTTVLDDCISRLGSITSRNYEPLTARPSLDLEWYVTRAMMVINNAIRVAPSFSIGDDGIPTGFKPKVSDIECYYDTFGMILEVTLERDRRQWVAEGQPVMRHFRDFEDKSEVEDSYCLFIAPLVHRDTLNTFWGGIKHEYEGKRQNIIPLTIAQFIQLLEIAKQKIQNGELNNIELKELFKSISSSVDSHANSQEWLKEVPDYIISWGR